MNTITLTKTCPVCSKQSYIKVFESEYQHYICGEYVQRAFPNMPISERETIISGLCVECQENIFG